MHGEDKSFNLYEIIQREENKCQIWCFTISHTKSVLASLYFIYMLEGARYVRPFVHIRVGV